jgi:hypothetical protein
LPHMALPAISNGKGRLTIHRFAGAISARLVPSEVEVPLEVPGCWRKKSCSAIPALIGL